MHRPLVTATALAISFFLLLPGPASGQSVDASPESRLPRIIHDAMLAPVSAPKTVLSSWPQAVALLRARSTDLRISLAEVRRAQGETRVALAQYLPSIRAEGDINHELITRANPGSVQVVAGGRVLQTRTIPAQDVLTGRVQLDQALLDVGAFDRIGIGDLVEDAGRLSVEDTQRTLLLALANQIVAVVTAERAAEVTRVGLTAALHQLELARRGRELGGSTALDVGRAEENAAKARAMLVVGDESLHETREALGLILGMPEQIGVAADLRIDGIATEIMTSCHPVRNIAGRPDMAAARLSVDVAKRRLRNVWFSYLPTISARSTLDVTSLVPPGYPNPTWSIEGVLSVPIWDGGARQGQAEMAWAAEELAVQQARALERRIIVEVDQAQRKLGVAQVSERVAREQRDAAAKNDELTQTAFLSGQATSLELVTASEAHRQAELNLVVLEYGMVRARLAALLALATCYP